MQNKRKSLGQSVMSTTNKTASASAITAAGQSAARNQSATHDHSASVVGGVTVSSGDVVQLISDLGTLMSIDDSSSSSSTYM